ncbi:trypsin-like peptidase domain-containing protein [Methylobacterium trifolii]|uniref:Serine protease n=1 Tax=Methylobacterium trifolii TaxID=1003092 RepID=A0ABQ4U6L2_9HYPH|nr:trypsin-like peptidase domain-containing protein [Methylobacterium trifolii]GJE62436.1 hypothetical protein MPOCJGCO_4569 [Methylobacterium trifolii]
MQHTDLALDAARDLVAEGQADEAVDFVRKLLTGQRQDGGAASRKVAEFHNEILLLSGDARDLARKRRLGLTDQQTLDLHSKRLRASLLALIDELEIALAARTLLPPAFEPRAANDFTTLPSANLERIWGRNTLQSLSWLHKAIEASRAVCRVVTPRGLGTGFLIKDGILVTNNHVIPTKEVAEQTVVEFNFQDDASGRIERVYAYCATSETFVTSSVDKLDCTMLKLEPLNGAPPTGFWGNLTLALSPKLEIGQPATIIQHPSGGLKKISLTANEVVNIFDHRLHYMTATMPGSSGAPVFADDWSVIAIHRAGGKLVKNARGDRLFANEGILAGSIAAEPIFASLIGSEII